MASEDPKKNAKQYKKNIKLSGFFTHFGGPNYLSYQLFEANFQESVFPKL